MLPDCLLYRNMDIMDNMVAKLEAYANNLEDIVEARTGELLEEKKKTDTLLYRMLPPYVQIFIGVARFFQWGATFCSARRSIPRL